MSAKAKRTAVGTVGWIVGMACAGIASAQAPPALLPEPDGVPKNRFISFSFPQSPEGTQWAVRVTLVKMHNDDPAEEDNAACPPRGMGCGPDGRCNLDAYRECSFDGDCPTPLSTFEGQIRWVRPTHSFPETRESDVEADPNRFIGAGLQCCPNFADWRAEMEEGCIQRCDTVSGHCTLGGPILLCKSDTDCPPVLVCDASVLHVFGAEIVSCSQYEVQLVGVSCSDLTDETCYSDPLTIHTAKWGDVWPPLGGERQPNFTDINKVVEGFKGVLPPSKVQVMLFGNGTEPVRPITFADIAMVVDGFKRNFYREVGPSPCTESCE